MRVLEGHRLPVGCVAALPDGRIISGGCSIILDSSLRVWDASSGVCERVVQSTDADYASLNSFGRERHSLRANVFVSMLATSTARIHASERLSASIAAGSIAAPVLVCGSGTGKIYFMTVVAAR